MKRALLFKFLLLLTAHLNISAQTPAFAWVRPGTVNSGGLDFGRGVKLATDSAGYTYVAGSYTGSTFNIGDSTLTAPNYDEPAMFVAKYDSYGNLLWIRETTNCYLSQPSSIALDKVNGKVYVTGRYCTTSTLGTASFGPYNFTTGFNSMYVSQLDAATGDVLWLKCTNVGSVQNVNTAQGNNVIASGNSLYVAGEYTNTVIFDNDTLTSIGDGDAYLAKYDSSGNLVWIRTAGYAYNQNYFNCVTADVAGNVYVSCAVMQTISIGSNTYTGDVLTIKYDATGALKWVKASTNGYQPLKVLFDSKDYLYVAGTFIGNVTFGSYALTNHSGNYGIFVAKYDTLGNLIWAKSPGGGFESYGALGMAFDQYDNFYLTGNYTGSATFDTSTINAIINGNTSDIFVAKFDTGAHAYWAKTAGGVYTDASNDVGADYLGNSYITGYIGADGSVTDVSFDTISIAVQPNDSYFFLAKIGTVTVAPLAQFAVSDSTICAGSQLTFTDQSTGYPTTVSWIFAGGNPENSSSPNPIVTYSAPGNYSVTLVVSNSSGKDSLTKTSYVTVHPAPVAGAIIGSDSICPGSSIQLTDTGSSGTIQWQNSLDGNTFLDVNGDTSATYINASLNQSAFYRVIINGICGTDTSLIHPVIVYTPPAPVPYTNDSAICSSDSTSICVQNNFISYQWNTSDTSFCTTVKLAGGYWVTVTDVNGCSAISPHQNISVYPVPSVSIVVQGDTLTSFNSNHFQWYFNDSAIQGATSSVYIAHQSGNYAVQIMDSNGCYATSNYTPVVINDIPSIYEASPLNVYPDPFTNYIFIGLGDAGPGIESIIMYDVLGRISLSKELDNAAAKQLELDVSALPPGIYYVSIKTNQEQWVRSIIKE